MKLVRQIEGLSSRCGAQVDDIVSFLYAGDLSSQHGTDILNLDASSPKSGEGRKIIITLHIISSLHIGSFLHGDILLFETFQHSLFLRLILPYPDSSRLGFQKRFQHLFRRGKIIFLQEPFHQPDRHGIDHRQIFHRTVFFRKMNASIFPDDPSEDSVNKACEIVKPSLSSQLHRFVAHCAVRHIVHIQELIYAGTEKFPDHRLHLFCRDRGKLIQDIVQADPVFQGSFAYPGNKSPLLFFQILIFFQGVAKDQMTVLSLLVDLQKNIQYQFS